MTTWSVVSAEIALPNAHGFLLSFPCLLDEFVYTVWEIDAKIMGEALVRFHGDCPAHISLGEHYALIIYTVSALRNPRGKAHDFNHGLSRAASHNFMITYRYNQYD